MTTRPTTLPGQIPPQNAPLSYLDANGQQITDINWYLFLYRLWKEVVSSTGANALLLAQDALLMDPVSLSGGGLAPSTVNPQPAAYTTVLGDANNIIQHPALDVTARVYTIAANASVAYPTGTFLSFDNEFGAGALTISVNADVMEMVGGAGSTGNRTIPTGGQATAVKITATKWRISGTGIF